jgi:hypothetical protein
MSQNSIVIPNTGTLSGLQMVNDANAALDTLNTLSSGAAAPTAPEADQWWMDTTNGILKQRDGGNANWIAQAPRAVAYFGCPVHSGVSSPITANTTMGTSYIGQVVDLNPSAPITLTIPLASTYPAGLGFMLRNRGTKVVTIQQQGTDSITFNAVYPHETIWVYSNGQSGSSGAWTDAGRMVSSMSFGLGAGGYSSGYLQEMAGVIKQWGTASLTTNSAGGGSISFASAFPQYTFSLVICPGDNNVVIKQCQVISSQVTNAGFGFVCDQASTPVRINYLAMGD